MNLEKNLQTCHEAGLESFIFEVVTDKSVNLPHCNRVREVVVPLDYRFFLIEKFFEKNF